VKFLVDNQSPTALARFLASRGVDCQHVLDLDLGDAPDAEIWEYAGMLALSSAKTKSFCIWRMYDPQKLASLGRQQRHRLGLPAHSGE